MTWLMRFAVMLMATGQVALAGPEPARPAGKPDPNGAGAAAKTGPKAGPKTGPKAAAKAAPPKMVDEGTFSITLAGRRVGKEQFSIGEAAGGFEIRSKTYLVEGGAANVIQGLLRTDDHFRPLSGEFDWSGSAGARKMILSQRNGLPELSTQAAGRTIMYTRPTKAPDVFLRTAPLILAHAAPLCRLAGPKEQTLTTFPAASLKLSAAAPQLYPESRVGAPSVSLTSVVVDLAQSARFELVCDGQRLIAIHLGARRLTAVRASFEAVASALEARMTRAKPRLPETVVEQPRTIHVPGAGGGPPATLACALAVPATHAAVKRGKKGEVISTKAPEKIGSLAFSPEVKPLPALLLVSDVEAQDRDGDPVGPGDPKLSILKRLAIRLGEQGFVTLRCDDRDAGKTPPAIKPPLEWLAADAGALVAALRGEVAVDPERVGVLGHGEGGLVALLAAQRDAKLKAIGLLATASRRLDALDIEQAEQSMRRFGYPDDEVQEALGDKRALYDAVAARKALPKTLSPTERQSAQRALAWTRSRLAHDPVVEGGRLKNVAVLVAQGGTDAQTSPHDAEALRDALAKGANKVTFKLYPQLNHPFASSPSGSLTDYLDPRADVADAFLGDVSAFCAEALGGAAPSPAGAAAPAQGAATK